MTLDARVLLFLPAASAAAAAPVLGLACHRAPSPSAPEKRSDASVAAPAASSACAALVSLALPHARVTEARAVDASPASPRGPAHPAYCRALGVATPAADSEIRFEVAIPLGDAWNGRYRQVGNGGFAGRVPEEGIVAAVAEGDAAAGTDDGHASASATDASWALGHPARVIDYGYRAVKETHDAALAVIGAFARKAPAHTYFIGCSDGGREALMEAQRYPGDFDGIVAGAPANYASRLLLHMAADEVALARTPASFVPGKKLAALEAASLGACGDEEHVVASPASCRFDPAVLRCAEAETDACVTEPQLAALRTLYGDLKNPRTGELLEPGFEPGAEDEEGSWSDWILGKRPGDAVEYRFASTFFRAVVFGDPGYDLARLDYDRDLGPLEEKAGAVIDAVDPDLTRFEARGGKLLQYHGWSDSVVPPRDSIRYFDSVRARVGGIETSGFYRLFMAPGMLHCDGGRGPNVLATTPAIRAWVEEGRAPEQVVAAKHVGNDPRRPIERTRPLCPYPRTASWSGAGDRARAETWSCGSP